MQLGYTKFMCPLCLWDSRANYQHYLKKDWPQRSWEIPVDPKGKPTQNVRCAPLVEPKDIILPPLHIKLGLMTNFVKAMNKNGPGFQHLKTIIPSLSEAKIEAGIFNGPQIRKIFKDPIFQLKLNEKERAA